MIKMSVRVYLESVSPVCICVIIFNEEGLEKIGAKKKKIGGNLQNKKEFFFNYYLRMRFSSWFVEINIYQYL